jgi:deoxyribonuclease IV
MLIGAHVSPAGGPAKAVGRGGDLGARSIQIFNQSPRMWRFRDYTEEEAAAFRDAMAASEVDALLIHAIYLINCAATDKAIRDKSRASLTASLRAGDALGAHAVVVHAGSALGGKLGPAVKRAGTVMKQALSDSDGCALHLENTAGAGGTLGRSFEELAELIDAAGGGPRLGLCLDSCHLMATGFDVRTPQSLTAVLDDCDATVGKGRLGSLHLNDSQTPLGSNRDRHANLGEGAMGEDGVATFLSEPRFDGLPCVMEIPGVDRSGPRREDVELATKLRKRGLTRRRKSVK